MRHVCEEDDFYLDKDSSFKRARLQGEKDENIVITSDHIRFKGKSFHVVQRVWRELDTKDREFVVSYNSKVKQTEPIDEIYVPAKF